MQPGSGIASYPRVFLDAVHVALICNTFGIRSQSQPLALLESGFLLSMIDATSAVSLPRLFCLSILGVVSDVGYLVQICRWRMHRRRWKGIPGSFLGWIACFRARLWLQVALCMYVYKYVCVCVYVSYTTREMPACFISHVLMTCGLFNLWAHWGDPSSSGLRMTLGRETMVASYV